MEFLLPPVKRFSADDGTARRFPLRFTFAEEGRQARLAGNYLVSHLGADLGAHPTRNGSGASDLLIRVRRGALSEMNDLPKDKPLRSQAYRLTWRPGAGACVEADTAIGALHGVMTLRQILIAQTEGIRIPAGVIEDWPSLKWRALQDDLARGRAFDMLHAKRQIRHLAELKGNMYQLYLETRFDFPRRPDAGMSGSMTPDDARELEAYAGELGVTLLPQVNTLAHMELLLSKPKYAGLREVRNSPFVICPLHPETRPLLKDLLDDIMDAFQTPFIHIGLDEVIHLGRCPRCRKMDPGDILLGHIRYLYGVVTARGRRTVVWHDMLLDQATFPGCTANGASEWASRVLDALPRDIIICDWQYNNGVGATGYFVDKGFEALACNFLKGPIHGRPFPFDFSAAGHSTRLFSHARRSGASGMMQTTWGLGARQGFENHWLLYAHSLSLGWQPFQNPPIRPFAEAWARIEMGIDGLEYEDVIARLSVPLFGGTGMRSITHEHTGPKFPLFRHARYWWRAMGRPMLRQERRFTDDLETRLGALQSQARRGRAYLALLDLPIMERRIAIDQVDKVGRAARMVARASALKKGDRQRGKSIRTAAGLIAAHARVVQRLLSRMCDLSKVQGVDEDHRRRVLRSADNIRTRAEWLLQERPFEEVFWEETETPYDR